MSAPIVLSATEWNTASIKYMAPKVNERGGKSINIISKQTNRGLHISTPLMMTWGVSDFVDEKTGESDGKYSISLNFPNAEYSNANTDLFLKKLKDFENQILDDAVTNSELWWGEEMSREVAKHTFFPFIKYSKNKDTKKIDPSKPPSIRAKVPFYNGKWNVEIYDTKQNMIFPCEQEFMTPVDFIPKMSQVACVLQCGGIWIGGKGWGLTWKLNQCIVKPREIISVYGKCQVQLSAEDCQVIETQEIKEDADECEQYVSKGSSGGVSLVKPATEPKFDTYADNSDDEMEPVVAAAPAPVTKKVQPQPELEASPEPDAESVDIEADAEAEPVVVVTESKPVKKIVKKAAVIPEPEPEVIEAPKKKIVKKK
jgi:hypothetical protein